MTQKTTIAKHAALFDEMGSALGVDLEEAVLRGKLDPDTLVDSVLSCTNCTNPDGCQQWLEQQDGTAEKTPHYCRNSELFMQLRGDQVQQ